MADVMEHVAYLSQEIGPRPAGTEEEQQAALYITEHMQKEAGLPAVIEDFTGVANTEIPRAICSGITLAFTILAVALPVVALPAAIVAILSAAIYVAEAFDKPILSRLFSRGVSQNVVAKYEPGYSPESGRSRRRKVILVAHYDSGKARAELAGPVVSALPIVKWMVLGAFVLAAIVLLLGATVLLNVSGAVDIVLNVIAIVAAVIAALPLVQLILHKTASYNDGANCNASGVAVLMDVAARVGRGRTDMSSFGSDTPETTIHGEEAAREAGLVPEGASISYEAAPNKAREKEETPAARLAAAKAAVAALSGKPVSDFMSEEILNASIEVKMPESHSEPQVRMDAAAASEPAEAPAASAAAAEQPQQAAPAAQVAVAPAAEQQPAAAPEENALPAWFVAAQKKAKKTADEAKPVQRSRYADALDAAVSASSAHFTEANNAVINNTQQRIVSMSDGIVEVPAPENAWQEAHPEHVEAQPATSQVVEMPAAEVSNAAVQTVPEQPAAAPVVHELASVEAADVAEAAPAAMIAEQPAAVAASILPDDLSVPDLPAEPAPALPSFLTQKETQSAEQPRTADRVQVPAVEVVEIPDPEPQPQPVDLGQTIAAAPVFVETVTAGAEEDRAKTQEHQPIVLPDIDASAAVQLDSLKQRAPLADAYDPNVEHGSKLRSSLPSIDPAHPAGTHRPSAAQLRSALPSFSGILPKVEEKQAEEVSSAVSLTGSFAPVGATSSFAPVGDELLEDVDPEDIYVDDADDSAFEDPHSDAGQFAAPGYVEMPKSRVRRLFDRFHRKGKEDERTPQEWLDVDESFEARSVGAARGSWESFRDEQFDDEPAAQSAPYAEAYADDAFDDELLDDYDDDFGYEPAQPVQRRPWNGGAFSRVRMGRVDMRSGKEGEPPLEGEAPPPPEPEAPEMQKIYQFRNPDIDTEVWFVALGAELGGHSGMRAFIAEHEHELRGSIIIELEALGEGEFCMIDQEGGYRMAKTSSRMRRYTRKASQETGVTVGSASMKWKSSASSYATIHGLQAMHLAGMEGGKPAGYGNRDDVAENVDESLLAERANYVMQILKNI